MSPVTTRPRPVRTLPAMLLLALLGAVVSPAPGCCESSNPPATNMELLDATTRGAVDSLLRDFPYADVRAVEITFASGDATSWLVGDALTRHFVERKIRVRMQSVPRPHAPGDTLGAAADPGALDARTDGDAPFPADILECRILECGVLYPRSWKAHWFGGIRVERSAAVDLTARLLGNSDDSIRWLGKGRMSRGDVVDGSDLRYVEGSSYPFTKPLVEHRGFGRYVEPLLVGAIVAGLVSLFYTNQR